MVVRKLGLIIIFFFCISFNLFANLSNNLSVQNSISFEQKSDYEKVYYSQSDINEMIDIKYGATYNSITHWSWVLGILITVFGVGIVGFSIESFRKSKKKIDESINSLKIAEENFNKINERCLLIESRLKEILNNVISSDLEKFEFKDLSKEKKGDNILLNRINTIETLTPSLSYKQLLAKSVILVRQAKYDQAIEILRKLIDSKKYPDDIKAGDLYYKMGVCLMHKGQLIDSIIAFTKAIEFNDKDYEAYINRGKIYLTKNEEKKALDDYKKLLEIDIKRAEGWTNLIEYYLKKRALNIVKDLYEQIDLLEISSIELEYNKICFYALDNQLEVARRHFLDFIKENSNRKNHLLVDGDLIELFIKYPDLKKI